MTLDIIKKENTNLTIRKKKKDTVDKKSIFDVYRSKKTIKDYFYYMTTFLNYVYDGDQQIQPEEIVKLMAQIEKEDVDDYVAYLVNEKKLKKTSVNTIISGIKSLFNELERNGYPNPTRHLRLFKVSRDLENVLKLSYEDIISILEKYPINSDKSYRNSLIVQTLFYTGMRSQELLDLKFNNLLVRDEEYFFKIANTKSGREQFKPVHEYLVTQLLEYRNYIKNFLKISDAEIQERHIFTVSLEKNKPLTYIGLNNIILALGKLIDKNISPHNIRHAVATELSLNGADILEIRDFLGHSDTKVTEVYINAKSILQKRALQKIPVPSLDGNVRQKKSTITKKKGKS